MCVCENVYLLAFFIYIPNKYVFVTVHWDDKLISMQLKLFTFSIRGIILLSYIDSGRCLVYI